LVAISDGFQFMTKAAYHDLVGQYLRIQSKKKLSRAAMETLAIIAYKQPMTKSGIESIRGVNCDYAILKLVEKELVEILGRAQTPGRPILYGTSDKFMDYFGIRDITDLPKLKEIIVSENSIGMEAGLEKLHKEGHTEDYKFHPDPEPINEEVDLSEVSVEIETTEELPTDSIEEQQAETSEEVMIDEVETTEEFSVESSDEIISEFSESQEEIATDIVDDNQVDTIDVEENEEEVSEKKISDSFEGEQEAAESSISSLMIEEINLPEIQEPLETFDLENNNEEIRNEEEVKSVNSEEN